MSEKVNYNELMDKEDPDIKVEMPSIDANDSILIIEKGSTSQWAALQENGEICVKITGWLKGGARGDNSYTLKPEEDEYKERKSKHRLEKPGDSSTIKKQWIDEKWILVPEGLEE